MIKRENYLSKIREFYDVDLIKVITGIRRCGKSTLLTQIIDEISLNVDKDHIIYINFEDNKNKFIKDYLDLDKYIQEKIKDDNKYYLFFDEIQKVDGWENTVNSLKATRNVSEFITGSNSKLLSGELATLLTGRYVSFTVHPFSFKEVVEYCDVHDSMDIENLFNNYLLWGGMPQRFGLKTEDAIRGYLSDTFDGIINKDIQSRNEVINVSAFKRLMEYFVTNPSQIFVPSKVMGALASDGFNVSSETINEYLEFATEAYLLEKVSMYDIRGKRLLNRNDKYYLTDLGLGQINNVNKKPQYGAYLENVIYNELLYRGYDVSYGSNNEHEVDFIATKGNIKEYYQVAFDLANETTEEREFGAYDGISDNYPKYVISMDKLDYSQNGIIHKNAIEWLLDDYNKEYTITSLKQLTNFEDFHLLQQYLDNQQLSNINNVVTNYNLFCLENPKKKPIDYITKYGDKEVVEWIVGVTSTNDFLKESFNIDISEEGKDTDDSSGKSTDDYEL